MITDITRRKLLGLLGSSAVIAGTTSFPFSVKAGKSTTAHIVVVGGGFGGATCVNYLHRFDPNLKITLIEPAKTFVTCPFSNKVIAGMQKISSIQFNYTKLAAQPNVTVVHDTVIDIDTDSKKISLSAGKKLPYDSVVLSPGVSFRWGKIKNNDLASTAIFPHAWKAGEQTILLAKQLQTMPDGGTFIISVPGGPFRAPPAPYERASLAAYYLKKNKPKSKILILDSSDSFEEQALFQQAWNKLYPDMIEWVAGTAGGKITRIDTKNKQVFAGSTAHKGDVINIIPPQQAGTIAIKAGLSNKNGWCEVKQPSFESMKARSVYVIGDACIAGDMKKLGHAANSQAKICAASIVSSLHGITMPEPVYNSSVYSVLSPKYAISSASVFRLKAGSISIISGGLSELKASKKTHRREASFAKGWYKSITSEMFLG
ncbi:Flavocytochrome c:sulfide dehydrogenase [hydrothermal vent metagenome]|uniref:Flavocytochrome c:sulfide dehydrogenase n=1 Tax=hydrothermal vent metagenome TaxID=652676 RepID=A0A3B0XJH8_9ZZZZ